MKWNEHGFEQMNGNFVLELMPLSLEDIINRLNGFVLFPTYEMFLFFRRPFRASFEFDSSIEQIKYYFQLL